MNLIEQSIYLELLRASLWERTPDLSVFHGEWSWTALFDAYKNHDQLGVVANTIALLPESVKPNEQEMNVVYQYVGSLIKSHHLLNTRLRDIMPQLEAAGCHPVLLKGQGLSTLYPKTCLRSCGDLDIYVGEENMDKAKAIVNAMATKEEVKQAEDSSHHYHIALDGVTYEIHRYPGSAGNKKYQDAYRSLATPCLQPDQCEQVTLPIGVTDKINVRVPSVDFNLWYVFNHVVTHFRNAEVGIRQFCDWLMVLREWNKRNSQENKSPFRSAFGRFDKACDSLGNSHSAPAQVPLQGGFRGSRDLEGILQSIGLLRAWQILGGFLVYQLGLPKEDYPLWNERLAKKSQGFILEEIMGGNRFSFASFEELGQQGHGLKHIWYNLRYYYYDSRILYLFSATAPYARMWKWLTGGAHRAISSQK